MATTVYFVTNRNLIPTGIENNFGTDTNRSEKPLRFGRAKFKSIDDEQDLRAANLEIDEVSTGDFSKAVRDQIVSGPNRLMLHVHGFDYRFREALMRAAKFKEWISEGTYGKSTTLILFSWPSLGSLSPGAYRQDVSTAKQCGPAFSTMFSKLVPLIQAYRAEKKNRVVALSAHSLGNLALTVGISSAVGSAPGQYNPEGKPPLFDVTQLFAADTDADALSDPSKLGNLRWISARTANYYNQQDLPLRTVSRWVHGEPRLGFVGASDMRSFKGLPYEFVNCSAASKRDTPLFRTGANEDFGEVRDWQWHQYYHMIEEIRDDICGVLAKVDAVSLPNRKFRGKENYYRLDL